MTFEIFTKTIFLLTSIAGVFSLAMLFCALLSVVDSVTYKIMNNKRKVLSDDGEILAVMKTRDCDKNIYAIFEKEQYSIVGAAQ